MGHIDRTEELVDSTGSPWSSSNPLPVTVIAGGGIGGTVDQGAAGVSAWPVSLASLPSLAAGANAIGTVGVTSLPALPAGANAIGTVSVTSLPALPAGANTIGKIDQGVGGASAWKVDGSAVTQPVSAAALPLPTGAATAAKQPALGVAGTASVDVLTVQGIASMTPLKVDGSGVTQPVSGSVTVAGGKTNNNAAPGATNVGTLGAVATAAAPSSTEGNQVALSTDLAGNTRVVVAKVPGSISSANSSTATLTSGSIFTGTSEDISGYAAVVVNVLADQAGTFSPQFSSDGSNWDFQGSHAIAAGVGQMFVFRPGAKFFRAIYTNGGTNQGAFRFQTIYHQDDVNFATAQTLAAGMANPTTTMVGANLLVQPSGGTTWSPVAADSSARPIVVVNGLPTAAAVGDGFANPTTTQMFTFPGVWNGATWDHWKDMAAAQAQTSFTGIPAMAPFYLDTTGTPSVRRGVTGASCTGGITGTQVPGSASLVWDGTTFRPQLSDTSGRTVVGGAAAAGAAVAGNPVLVGGVTPGGLVGTESVSNLGSVAVGALNGSNQAVDFRANVELDGNSNSINALIIAARNIDFNGGSWDRHRNNVDVTLLASAARTTTQGPTTLTTYNLGAIVFVLDMTAVGTGSVTLTISEVDPASGKSILLLSGAAVTTNSTNVYTIDPMLTAAANSIAKNRVTRTLSWQVTANNANAATYSLGAMELVP